MSKDVRSVLSIILAAMLLAAGSMNAYAQARKPAPKAAPKAAPKVAPAPATPYEQGYQQGYNEGFKQGGTDYNRGVPRDLESSDAYRQRDRLYDASHASNEEYLEGYNLGMELGYTDGYYGRTRNAAVPANGAIIAKATVLSHSQRSRQATNEPPLDRNPPPDRIDRNPPPDRIPGRNSGPVNIPAGTELNIKLTSPIDTKDNRSGDRFTAEVITPGPYDRAKIEGHIANINKSGKVSGRTELALAFDSITLPDGRLADIAASLERIIESETVKEVDEEGNVRSGSRTKDSQVRGGVGAAAGAVIGGIAGGVKGAVLGAIIGGAAGVGTVYIEGNKNLILDPGTEMVIRTERSRAR